MAVQKLRIALRKAVFACSFTKRSVITLLCSFEKKKSLRNKQRFFIATQIRVGLMTERFWKPNAGSELNPNLNLNRKPVKTAFFR